MGGVGADALEQVAAPADGEVKWLDGGGRGRREHGIEVDVLVAGGGRDGRVGDGAPATFTPGRSPGMRWIAPCTPCEASATAYGSVAFVSA